MLLMKCVNEECNKNPYDSPDWVPWGCDFDACCNQSCYEKARQQMDYFCRNILPDDSKLSKWLGVPHFYG